MLTNKEIVQEVNEAISRSDVNTFLAHCADNIQWIIFGRPVVSGKDDIRDSFGPPDVQAPMEVRVEHTIAEGDVVCSNGTLRMQHADGSWYHADFCDIYSFRNGKIETITCYVIDNRK